MAVKALILRIYKCIADMLRNLLEVDPYSLLALIGYHVVDKPVIAVLSVDICGIARGNIVELDL